MVPKLNIDVKHGDLLSVNPEDLKMPKQLLRGRVKPLENEKIQARAESIFDNGQQQPVVVRLTADKLDLEQISGFTRAAAIKMIRSGFKGSDGVKRQDEHFLLKCVIQECDDKQAFVNTLIENVQREDNNPIDHAHNQKTLRGTHGMADAEIARIYNWDPATVSRHKGLLKLNAETQELVRTGRMAMNAALDLLSLPEGDRAEVVKRATVNNPNGDGKVKSDVIRKSLREMQLAKSESAQEKPAQGKTATASTTTAAEELALPNEDKPAQAPAKSGKNGKPAPESPQARTRTLKEVKEFFIDVQTEMAPSLAKLCKKILEYCEGRISDKQLVNAFVKSREEKE